MQRRITSGTSSLIASIPVSVSDIHVYRKIICTGKFNHSFAFFLLLFLSYFYLKFYLYVGE